MARICILLPSHWGAAKGGAELQAHVLADHLARNTNHHVVYLTRRAPADCGGYAYQLRQIEGRRSLRHGLFWDLPLVMRALSDVSPDLIIQRVASAYTGMAALYALRHHAKLIWHVSSDRDVSANPQLPVGTLSRTIDVRLFRYGVRRADVVIAQTEQQSKALNRYYKREAGLVVPNFSPSPEKTWSKSDRFTILWIANLKSLKRPEMFIQLARDLQQEAVSFKVIGRSDDTPWCRSILDAMSKTPNLTYLGELELEAVNAELERAHLLVNTSLFEGLPNTFIQAWLREVPTLTTGVDPDGAINSLGIGRSTSSYDDLKSSVLHYVKNRGVLADQGSRARAFALEKFSMRNVRTLLSTIDDVLSSV
jgi:glycosyltransferase involved in cell wall biosynthesis